MLASCTLNVATATSASPAFVQGSVKVAENCLAASQPKLQREAVSSLEGESHIHLMQLFVLFLFQDFFLQSESGISRSCALFLWYSISIGSHKYAKLRFCFTHCACMQ